MKITRKQLRQIIKEEAQARDWTSFDDAKMASLESTSDEPVYWYNPKDERIHTLVNGVVAGNSPKVVHGSRDFLAHKRKAKENPGAYFNFTSEEETLAEGNKMKITRRQLRQIINEELRRVLMEEQLPAGYVKTTNVGDDNTDVTFDTVRDSLNDTIKGLIDRIMTGEYTSENVSGKFFIASMEELGGKEHHHTPKGKAELKDLIRKKRFGNKTWWRHIHINNVEYLLVIDRKLA